MGRYDFRPSRVHQATSQLLNTSRLGNTPSWYHVVGGIPPSQILVRTQPTQHPRYGVKKQSRKASKQFRPQPITYEEDILRRTFFKDHPWELARPRVMLENDGRGYQVAGRTSLSTPGTAINGESVVQRQLHLMNGGDALDRSTAYDQARQEFYQHRLDEEIGISVAREEATAAGAYFGKSMVQIGGELEDQSYDSWRVWAEQEHIALEQRNAGTASDSVAIEENLDATATEPEIEQDQY